MSLPTIRDSAIYSRCREMKTEKDSYQLDITDSERNIFFHQFKNLKEREPETFSDTDTDVVFLIDLGTALNDDKIMMCNLVINNKPRLDETLELDELPVIPGLKLKEELINHIEAMLPLIFAPVLNYLSPNLDRHGTIALATICAICSVMFDDPKEVILMIKADRTQESPFKVKGILRKDRKA